jgi:hypothetical protein
MENLKGGHMNLDPGLYWAKPLIYSYKKELKEVTYDGKNEYWELVEVRPENDNLVVYHMGWDCSEPITSFVNYTKATIHDPDGRPYMEAKC